jgi:phospholipase/lecithinase/hemolysin
VKSLVVLSTTVLLALLRFAGRIPASRAIPNRKIVLSALVAVFIFVLAANVSRADSFSAVIAYGDSLSDNGNFHSHLGLPYPPYYDGRFSNGPVTVEQLASMLNAPLYDFAWAGATTGVGSSLDGGTQTSIGYLSLPGMLTELAGYPLPTGLVPSALFFVWGGADDYEAAGSPTVAASNIIEIVTTLQAEGAQHIVVPNLPDLGLTPEFYGSTDATQFSLAFDQALAAGLPQGATLFDAYGLLNAIVSDPGMYGLTNVTQACFNGTTVCSDPNQYLFWDDIHPTEYADGILASEINSSVTPEPSTLVLLGTGVAGLLGFVRRNRMS